MHVDRLHFLIHPGYRADNQYNDSITSVMKQVEEQHGPQIQKYIRAAQAMKRSEIMFLFSHAFAVDLLSCTVNKAHVEVVYSLRKILGNRLQVIPANFWIFSPEDARAFMYGKSLARRNGYDFTSDVPTVAYGEKIRYCVEEGADALNKAAGLTQKTVIEPRRCDIEVALQVEPDLPEFMKNNGYRSNIAHRQIDPVTLRRLSQLQD